MSTTFTNPYSKLNKDQVKRTTIVVANATCAALAAVRPRCGTLQTTVYILLEKLKDELKRIELTSYDGDRYERLVAGAVLTLGGGVGGVPTNATPIAVRATTEQIHIGDVGSGIVGVARPVAAAPGTSDLAGPPPGSERPLRTQRPKRKSKARG